MSNYISNKESKNNNLNNLITVYDTNSGSQKIQNVSADIISCKFMTIDYGGTFNILGVINSNLNINNSFGLILPNGSSDNLSLKFNSNPNTGLYLNNDNINIQQNGSQIISISNSATTVSNVLKVPTISTTSGNLVLNPNGPAIDFNGKNLLNVGTISANPYVYKIIAPNTVITNSISNYTILSIGIAPSQCMMVDIHIIGVDSVSLSSITFSQTLKITNNVSISYLAFNKITAEDNSLSNATLTYLTSTNLVYVQINPGISTTTKWFGTADVIIQSF